MKEILKNKILKLSTKNSDGHFHTNFGHAKVQITDPNLIKFCENVEAIVLFDFTSWAFYGFDFNWNKLRQMSKKVGLRANAPSQTD